MPNHPRFAGQVFLRAWDEDLALACVRAVACTECPAWADLPSTHSGWWDPSFAACAGTATVVCMHIGSGTRTTRTGPDAPDGVHATNISMIRAASMVDFLLSGVLARHPRLRLLYAEARIGWIPFVLDRVDDVWHNHRWARGVTPAVAGELLGGLDQDSVDRIARGNAIRLFDHDLPGVS